MNRSNVRVLSLLILIFSFQHLQAAVQPIIIGEGNWNVLTRIGITIDQLSDVCTFTFGQAEFGAGYTIVSPGVYCLIENVSGSASPNGVTVASNGVTIDLQGHTMAGVTTAINLGSTSVSNLIIKNGIIRNCTNGIFNSSGAVTLTNIAIRDMNFNNNTTAVSLTTGPLDGLLIENCFGYNSSRITANSISSGAVVRGCLLEERRGGGIAVGVTLFGNSTTANLTIEDCIATGSFSVNPANFSVALAENGTIQNCIAQEGGGPMFDAQRCKNLTVSDCIAQRSDSTGFFIAGGLTTDASIVVERCVASQTAGFIVQDIIAVPLARVALIDCIAENNNIGNGFTVFPFSVSLSDVVFKRCCAINNTGAGFVIYLPSGVTGDISNIVFEDCLAQGNVGDGFIIVNAKATGVIDNVVFNNCTSQGNIGGALPIVGGVTSGNGFGVGATVLNVGLNRKILFENCIADHNLNNGFSLATTASSLTIDCRANFNGGNGFFNSLSEPSNIFLSNVATFNTSGNFAGVNQPVAVSAAIAGVPNAYYNIAA
jgi:hypothetical protein